MAEDRMTAGRRLIFVTPGKSMVTTSLALNKILFLRIDLTGVFEREGGKILLILVAPAFTLLHDGHARMRQVLENNRREAETLRRRRSRTSRAKISWRLLPSGSFLLETLDNQA